MIINMFISSHWMCTYDFCAAKLYTQQFVYSWSVCGSGSSRGAISPLFSVHIFHPPTRFSLKITHPK